MKKRTIVFLKVIYVLIIVGAIECFIGALLYEAPVDDVKNISDVDIYEINDYSKIYFEEIEVLERYAFKTAHEYSDSENSYSDVTYYVYQDSHPMDDNQLFAEYYIVKFSDKTGKEYITSLSVAADENVKLFSDDMPLKMSVCAGASLISSDELPNLEVDYPGNNEIVLRETTLNKYSQSSGISRACITLGYIAEDIEEYQQDVNKDNLAFKIALAVIGVVLTIVSIVLIRFVKKKTKESKNHSN